MLDVSAVDGGSVVHLVGELDLQAEGPLRQLLARKIEEPTTEADLILDLGGVTFIDSSGLNAILWACQEMGEARRLRLRNASTMVRRVLDVSGVHAMRNLVVEEQARRAAT